jgi:hypothetical protein
MYRIPVINQNERFLDIDGEPLVRGKVEVLDPVSNNPLTIWTYSDDEYTVEANPVILDVEGRVPYTTFCDRIVYIRVYKYLGLDEWNKPMYEFVRDYYAGQNENTESREYVIGISALKNLDPSANSSVNVLGYYTAYDCGMRTYVWDENCTLDQDGGYVIGSNVSDSGRWILSFDGMYIPSSYYGVYPGSISNMNALLTYVDEIKGKKTAPGIYFIPGHYQTTGWLNTTKKLLISSNSQFDNGISCSWVDVKGKPTTWIGDIQPTDSNCPVHSCWYKNARSWWGCASRQKYCDGKNWTNNQLTGGITNTAVTFYTDGSGALNTDTGSYYLVFNMCRVVGPGSLLQRDSKCRFINMPFSDRYYLNHAIYPENIEFTNLSGQECTFDADDFIDVANMAKVAYKNGVTELNFKNRSVATVDATEYVSVKNGTINTLTFGKNDAIQETLKNVTVSNSLVYNGKSLNLVNSTVRLSSFPNLNSIYVNDNSTVRSGWTLNRGLISCNDSTWQMDTSKDVTASFNDSVITSTVRSKWIAIYNSRISSGVIQVYPYTESSPSSHYEFRCILENNTFDTDVAFVPDGLNNIYWNVKITNNSFNGSQGLTCPYWIDITTAKRAIAAYTTSGVVHHVDYAGNRGNCPKDRFTGQLWCSLTPWVTWNPTWMRGKTNPQVQYKVFTKFFPRFFLVENDYAIASPHFTRDDDWGFGMLMGTDTNMATCSLVNLSEMLVDSIDSDFIADMAERGFTPENTNDYFKRAPGLASSEFATNKMYYFWQ